MKLSKEKALEAALTLLAENLEGCRGIVVIADMESDDPAYSRYLTGAALAKDIQENLRTPRDTTEAMAAIVRGALEALESDDTIRTPLKKRSRAGELDIPDSPPKRVVN